MAVLVTVTSGCTGVSSGPEGGSSESAPATRARTTTPFEEYVALGDSFTAAPYVPTTDLADGCLRSDGNYPSLVAKRLDIADFTDVSCSAARIRDLDRPQKTFRDRKVPAQFDALTKQTDLVTISIGGNDFNLFGNLLRTCIVLRIVDPDGAPCTAQLTRDGVDPAAQTELIGARLRDAITEVHRRSPGSRILVVGYPRIAPADDTCPRLLPLATGDYVTAASVTKSLHLAMQAAATSTGVGFIDMYAPSRGHDVCSKAPWVNGSSTDQRAALAFHPFARGMRAVAARIIARLE
jgi:lysophospholipase L1-like esterase